MSERAVVSDIPVYIWQLLEADFLLAQVAIGFQVMQNGLVHPNQCLNCTQLSDQALDRLSQGVSDSLLFLDESHSTVWAHIENQGVRDKQEGWLQRQEI